MDLFIVSNDCIVFEKPIKILIFDKVNILGKKCLFVNLKNLLITLNMGYILPYQSLFY